MQKQLFRGVLRKRCSENMQQLYRTTPMPKCDFNKVETQLYLNHTSTSCSPVKLLHTFRIPFPKGTFGRLLLDIVAHLFPMHHFSTPENIRKPYCFQGVEKGCIENKWSKGTMAWHGLIMHLPFPSLYTTG